MEIDAVRFHQDFSQVTVATITALATRFVTKIQDPGGGACAKGEPYCKCPKPDAQGNVVCTYEPHTSYAVADSMDVVSTLGFSEQEKKMFWNIVTTRSEPSTPGQPFHPGRGARYVWPVDGPITTPFGMRISPTPPFVSEMHWGVDIGASTGTPIRAAEAGRIHLAAWAGNYGQLVVLVGDDGMVFWHGHLSEFAVIQGQRVQAGDIIGFVGTTGRSTGPHLHFETRIGDNPVDPLPFYR
jgi:murein DD-endopeptidase MepM/ murein hydrolase activator NlpD